MGAFPDARAPDTTGMVMDFEGDCTRELLWLARQALCDENADKGHLCAAAVKAIDNPPRDGILRNLADRLCQAAFDWAYFDGSAAPLRDAIAGYRSAVDALEFDERLHNLRF